MIHFETTSPATEEDIASFEAEFDLVLPTEYHLWLRDVGGSRTSDDYGIRNAVVGQFYTLGAGRDLDLRWQQQYRYRGVAAFVPREFLIIAPGAGAYICLKLTEPDQGSIWYANLDRAVERLSDSPEDDETAGPQPYIMEKLTDSLRDFIATYPDEA